MTIVIIMTIILDMRTKSSCILHAVGALGIGALLYFLFRPHTLFLSWLTVQSPFWQLQFPGDTIVRYFLPDALWSYSLTWLLFRVHLPTGRKTVLLSALSFVFGCFWETLQYTGYVPGTGDMLDCVAYGVGAVTALCIYIYLTRRRSL